MITHSKISTNNFKNKPLVSIIILNFNGSTDTVKCLGSLKKTKYTNYEIILIDNGSVKNELPLIRTKLKGNILNKIRYFRLNSNLGFTGGNNWGIKKVRGKYIVLLNNDTLITPSWLEPLVLLLESDKNIAVAQPKIKMMQNKKYFDYAGAAGGFIDKYGFPFTRGRIFNTQEKDMGQYNGTCQIFWASGAACIIRKSVIKKVGGLFSENLFNYMEEIDFCWRVWRAGFKVIFTSNSEVYHKVAATAGKNIELKRFWEHRNNLYILVRNLERKDLVMTLTVRIFFELIAYPYYFISRQSIFIPPLFKAHLNFIKNGLYLRRMRNRKLTNGNIPIYPRSILINHYLMRKKYFTDLKWSSINNSS